MSHTQSLITASLRVKLWIKERTYILCDSHALFLILTYPIFAQLEGFAQVVWHMRWNPRSTFFFFLFWLSLFLFIVYYSSKTDQKSVSILCPRMLHVPVYILRVCVVIFPSQPKLKIYSRSFIFSVSSCARGFLHCVTTELKGGICDLISPGNIKEVQCFIHRHKAPEFTQIKFARLCLRDQAWGLTHIEMIGFLRLIKKKEEEEEGGGKLWVQERMERWQRRSLMIHF